LSSRADPVRLKLVGNEDLEIKYVNNSF
jgi:hypothetical protein